MLEALIIGGGISGLTVAYASGLLERPEGFELWESSDRLGGTIGTDRVDGYSVDWGPNGFLDREPLTLRLAEEIGLKGLLEPANSKSEERFIVKHGKLHPVPFCPDVDDRAFGSPRKSPRFLRTIYSRPPGRYGRIGI